MKKTLSILLSIILLISICPLGVLEFTASAKTKGIFQYELTGNEATITLKNPTRKGYKFMGWYSDSKFKKRVTKIAKGSTGNKTLYAKWAKK